MTSTLYDTAMAARVLRATVEQDEATALAVKNFDVPFEGTTAFVKWETPDVGRDFSIGLIVGPSGTGKSHLLADFGATDYPTWDRERAIVSQFANPDDAIDRLGSVGLNTVRSWLKPYHVLSNGERHRADMARMIGDDACIDEFTSVVDRTVAHATANAVRQFVKRRKFERVVFATCHYDVGEWLEPDWVFDTASGELARGRLQRPKIRFTVHESGRDCWPLFAKYHYLSATLNASARCFLAIWNGIPIAFNGVLPQPSGTVQRAWRSSRLVVLPDYQGLGVGMRFNEACGQIHRDEGKRYFIKTTHPRMGAYLARSSLWRATSSNLKPSSPHGKLKSWKTDPNRLMHSYEYVGDGSPLPETKQESSAQLSLF